MKRCSICEKLRIVTGGIEDYKQLARYHYRDSRPGPCKAVFVLQSDGMLPGLSCEAVVGVIVYSTATAVLEHRNAATDDFFAGLDRNTQLGLINKNIRRISRLVIEPRFRGLGLATRLVRETMPQLNVPIIEAVAVMGRVNPFLEKAGMKAYRAKPRPASLQLAEAFSLLGMEDAELVDAQKVQQKLDGLTNAQAEFIERCIGQFLKSHGRRRDMPPGLERTRYVLGALGARPTYYIWFNPKFDAGCLLSDARLEPRKEAC
jgi:GNAT superfamily N-acetyltransferase